MPPSPRPRPAWLIGILLGVFLLTPADLWAQQGPGRWVADSTSARLYNPATVDTVRGTLVRVDSITAPRRAARSAGRRAAQRADKTALHLAVDTGTETVPVHLGPAWFFEREDVQLRTGDAIEIVGSRVTVRNEPVLIAARLKQGDWTVRLREANGRPVWRGGRR